MRRRSPPTVFYPIHAWFVVVRRMVWPGRGGGNGCNCPTGWESLPLCKRCPNTNQTPHALLSRQAAAVFVRTLELTDEIEARVAAGKGVPMATYLEARMVARNTPHDMAEAVTRARLLVASED